MEVGEHQERIGWVRQQEDGEVLLSPAWEVFILGVSILSVLNLLLVVVVRSQHLDQVFVILDGILTVVFLLDLGRRLVVATDRRKYLVQGHGWVDVLAAFPILRILRVLRIVRVARVMGRLGGPWQAFRAFFSNRAEGSLLSVLLVAILVLEFGSLTILAVEQPAPDANITTAADAVWYTLVTMSTVGYGDQYPVTDAGRLVGSLIIVVGVGVFGTLTGFLANSFLSPSESMAAIEQSARPTDEHPSDEHASDGEEYDAETREGEER